MKKLLLILFIPLLLSAQTDDEILYWLKLKRSAAEWSPTFSTLRVECGIQKNIVTGVGNLSAGGHAAREFFFFGKNNRVNQSGVIDSIVIYCASLTGMDSVKVKFWRERVTGYTFDCIDSSNNFKASLVAGQTCGIKLTKPLYNVEEGDYYSLTLYNGTGNFFGNNDADVQSYYKDDQSVSGNFDWRLGGVVTPAAGYNIVVKFFAVAPQIVDCGNSIHSGYNIFNTYIENDTTFKNIKGTILAILMDSVQALTGNDWNYRNKSIAGSTTTTIKTRFMDSIVTLKPGILILEGGVNDVLDKVGVDTLVNTVYNNFKAILDTAKVHKIKVIMTGIQPITVASNTRMYCRDTINARLKAYCQLTGHIYIEIDEYIGQERTTGTPTPPVGNHWDLVPANSSGDGLGIHLNITPGNVTYANVYYTNMKYLTYIFW